MSSVDGQIGQRTIDLLIYKNEVKVSEDFPRKEKSSKLSRVPICRLLSREPLSRGRDATELISR